MNTMQYIAELPVLLLNKVCDMHGVTADFDDVTFTLIFVSAVGIASVSFTLLFTLLNRALFAAMSRKFSLRASVSRASFCVVSVLFVIATCVAQTVVSSMHTEGIDTLATLSTRTEIRTLYWLAVAVLLGLVVVHPAQIPVVVCIVTVLASLASFVAVEQLKPYFAASAVLIAMVSGLLGLALIHNFIPRSTQERAIDTDAETEPEDNNDEN